MGIKAHNSDMQFWGASSLLCWFNEKEFFVYYKIQSNTTVLNYEAFLYKNRATQIHQDTVYLYNHATN